MQKLMITFLSAGLIAPLIAGLSSNASAKEIKVAVKGMVCGFCAQGITKKFKSQPEVDSVDVSLENKIVTLKTKDDANLSDAAISKILTDAGYSVESVGTTAAQSSSPETAQSTKIARVISVSVTHEGFNPALINVAPGTDLTLIVTRKVDDTCTKEIQVPSKNIKKTALPLNKPVSIALGVVTQGEIKFGCGMNLMDAGKVVVR